MNSTVKTVLFWVGIGVSALVLWTVIQQGRNGQKDAEINFSQFMTDVDQGKVHEVTVDGMQLRGKLSDSSAFHTTVPEPMRSPSRQPLSMGPPDSTIAGMFTVAAAIRQAGVVLSQPVVSTTPSMG